VFSAILNHVINHCSGEMQVLEHPYWPLFCTDTILLAEYFKLEDTYWLNILNWKIPTGWIFVTGRYLLAEYF
jgi:hypothetical protein